MTKRTCITCEYLGEMHLCPHSVAFMKQKKFVLTSELRISERFSFVCNVWTYQEPLGGFLNI
jgi:hypothetical protein